MPTRLRLALSLAVYLLEGRVEGHQLAVYLLEGRVADDLVEERADDHEGHHLAVYLLEGPRLVQVLTKSLVDALTYALVDVLVDALVEDCRNDGREAR